MVSPIDVFPRQAVESDALLSPSASREGWLHGEVGAFDSHEEGAREESDCSGSRVKRVLTRSEDKVDKAENDTVTLHEEKSEVHPGRKDMTPNVPWAAFGVRSVVAWRKTVTLNEEKSEVPPRRKDMTPNAPWAAFGVRSVVARPPEDVFSRQVWRAMLLSSLSTSRPRRFGWLHCEVDALDFRPAEESDCCDCWSSHVKRVLTDTGGVWRAERRADDVMSAREAHDEVSRARHR